PAEENKGQPKSPKGAEAKQPKTADARDDDAATAEGDGDNAGGGQDAAPANPKSSSEQKSGKIEKTRATASRTESGRDFSDAPVNQADDLIAGGDCNSAIRVLRAAGDNPHALTKLGAMYL